MSNKAYAFIAGLFVLLLTAAVIVAAVWLSGALQDTKPYIVVTSDDVDGLTPQADVTFRGITAGKVTALQLDPHDPHRTLIRIAVAASTPVTQDTYAVLKMKGFTGSSKLALETGGASTAALDTSEQSPARISMRPSLLDRLSTSGSQVVQQLDTLTAALNATFDAKNREHLARLLQHADAASARLTRLETDLDAAARRLPALSSRMQTTLKRIDTLTAELDRAAKHAAKLSVAGEAAGEKINRETLPRLDKALSELGAAAHDIRRLSESLRADPQQFLMGPQETAPGPGERGYQEPSR